ncbi:hypothetical protein ACHAWF_006929 [Thalassiosira exigua]
MTEPHIVRAGLVTRDRNGCKIEGTWKFQGDAPMWCFAWSKSSSNSLSGEYSGGFDWESPDAGSSWHDDNVRLEFVQSEYDHYDVSGDGSNDFGSYTIHGTYDSAWEQFEATSLYAPPENAPPQDELTEGEEKQGGNEGEPSGAGEMDFSDDVEDDSDDSEEDPDIDPEDMQPSTGNMPTRMPALIHCPSCSPRPCTLPADRIGWYYENFKAGYYEDDEGNSADVMVAFIAALQAQVYDASRLKKLLALTKIGASENAWKKLMTVRTLFRSVHPSASRCTMANLFTTIFQKELRGEVEKEDGEQAMHCANYRHHEEGEK